MSRKMPEAFSLQLPPAVVTRNDFVISLQTQSVCQTNNGSVYDVCKQMPLAFVLTDRKILDME